MAQFVLLIVVLVGTLAASPLYRREDWPHWAQSERVGCGTVRHEVLIRDSTRQHEVAEVKQCDVSLGTWIDPYSKTELVDLRVIDVDHVVPLRWAALHGGAAWGVDRRRAYANDVSYSGHLLAVSASLNRQKGARGPAAWRPPNPGAWCGYALRWTAILVVWELRPGDDDREALRTMLATCGKGGLPE